MAGFLFPRRYNGPVCLLDSKILLNIPYFGRNKGDGHTRGVGMELN